MPVWVEIPPPPPPSQVYRLPRPFVNELPQPAYPDPGVTIYERLPGGDVKEDEDAGDPAFSDE